MKNRVKLKKCLVEIIVFSVCLLVLFLIVNRYEYYVYTKNFNNKIINIVDSLEKEYPNLTEEEIVKILNSKGNESSNVLKKYGINLNDKAIIRENDRENLKFLVVNISFLIVIVVVIIVLFMKYFKDREKNLEDITKYIKQLNKKNYSLKIESNSEDELSILKNEIYKTTVMLKEAADNSKKDKLNLKMSLEDISHQLKTPLTSILVMLDNIIDEEDMDKKTKEEFLMDIKRNVVNINFLVQSILKLSKFDANTINFVKKKVFVKDIIKEVSKNLSTLCDLKNIKLNIKGSDDVTIVCDFMWQVEAITNIVKNSIEHSYNDKVVDISYEKNNVYTMLTIKDYGVGIEKDDLPHIFERFYKGKNSSSDSIGIGLALAKTIIEKDNGSIEVIQDKVGTRFVIKYFNYL